MAEQETQAQIELTYQDGAKRQVLPQAFFDALLASSRVTEAHISMEEGRQRQSFEGVKRFVSRKIDFSQLWGWVDLVKDPEQHRYARKCAHAAIHKVVMQHEAIMFNELALSLGRDNLPRCERLPSNPFVQTDDLEEALTVFHQQGGRHVGSRQGQIVK